MPFHHADNYNHLIKRRCDCGGAPEMIIDFVDDFVVRCSKCHVSTHAYIKPDDAIEHWDKGDDIMPPLDLLMDDPEKYLSGEVMYMAIDKDDADQINQQSCDCTQVVIVMRDRILLLVHEPNGEDGAIEFERLSAFNQERFCLRISAPQNGPFEFVKVLFAENGEIDGIKYRYGDNYVFISPSEYNLIVTKSVVDLFEEDDTPIPDVDPSILFDI